MHLELHADGRRVQVAVEDPAEGDIALEVQRDDIIEVAMAEGADAVSLAHLARAADDQRLSKPRVFPLGQFIFNVPLHPGSCPSVGMCKSTR